MDKQKCDKMILAVIQGDDYQDAVSELNEKGFYVTILHSSGGFLKKQSVTIMVGLNHEELEEALGVLKKHGERTAMQYQPVIAGGCVQPMAATIPIPTHLGGVVLFVLDVEQHERY